MAKNINAYVVFLTTRELSVEPLRKKKSWIKRNETIYAILFNEHNLDEEIEHVEVIQHESPISILSPIFSSYSSKISYEHAHI